MIPIPTVLIPEEIPSCSPSSPKIRTTEITNIEEAFAKGFTVSPDGKWVVFERTKAFVDDEADLWITRIDGKGMRLLVKGANHPAWRK